MNRYRIELLGSSFSIETDQSDASMDALLSRVKGAVSSARRQTASADPLKLAIIGSLILADELAACRASLAAGGSSAPDPGLEEAERIALKLISDLDERLGG